MGMTMTQKILAAHAGLNEVVPGQLIEAGIDFALANDVTAPMAIRVLRENGFDRVFDREKVEYKVEDDENMDIFSDLTASRIISLANGAGVEVVSITENNESLEGYFMNLVAKKDGIS